MPQPAAPGSPGDLWVRRQCHPSGSKGCCQSVSHCGQSGSNLKKSIRCWNEYNSANEMLRKHANDLFLKLQTLKFMDLLDFKTTQIIYIQLKINYYLKCPEMVQREQESGYNLRRRGNLQSRACTTLKSMCISVKGASLWNG